MWIIRSMFLAYHWHHPPHKSKSTSRFPKRVIFQINLLLRVPKTPLGGIPLFFFWGGGGWGDLLWTKMEERHILSKFALSSQINHHVPPKMGGLIRGQKPREKRGTPTQPVFGTFPYYCLGTIRIYIKFFLKQLVTSSWALLPWYHTEKPQVLYKICFPQVNF